MIYLGFLSYGHDETGRCDARRCGPPGGTPCGPAPAGVPHHVPVPEDRRQGDPAQEPEPDLLPDQRRRPRSDSDRGRPLPAARLRLVLPILPGPRPVPRARRDALRDVPPGRGRRRRPGVRRPADAVPLGTPPPQHRVPEQPDRIAVPPRRRVRRGRTPLRETPCHRTARRALQGGRSVVRLHRRRHDERGRVLGIAEHRLPRPIARRLSHRGQRLGDLRAGRGADAWREHLGTAPVVPQSAHREGRRHGLRRQLPRHAGSRRLRPGAARPRAGACERRPPVLPFAVRRRAAVQDAGRA